MKKRSYDELVRKLHRIEALYRRPGTEGERVAAAQAMKRIQHRLTGLRRYENLVIREYTPLVFTKE